MTTAAWTFFLMSLSSPSWAEVDLTLEQVLARHQATVDRLKHCTVKTQERWMMKSADGTPEKLLSTRNCDVRLDGARANLLVFEANYPAGVLSSDNSTEGNANEFNYVCDGQALEIFYPHEQFSVRPSSPRGVTGRLSPQKDDEFFVQNAMGNAALAFSMTPFTGSITIARLISLGKNERVTKDEIGYRVEGKAPDGSQHTIWFDPERSFVISRVKLEQRGETLKDNRYQYNRRVLKSRYGFSDKAVVDSVVVEIQNIEIVPWKDTHLVAGLEATKTVTAVDGTKAIERTTHKLSDWNLEPDFSDEATFKPWLPVPEGARVEVRDTPSLEYTYKNGVIQLAINQKTVDSLETVQLPRRSAPPRMQWIWAIVATVLGVTWWRMRAGEG